MDQLIVNLANDDALEDALDLYGDYQPWFTRHLEDSYITIFDASPAGINIVELALLTYLLFGHLNLMHITLVSHMFDLLGGIDMFDLSLYVVEKHKNIMEESNLPEYKKREYRINFDAMDNDTITFRINFHASVEGSRNILHLYSDLFHEVPSYNYFKEIVNRREILLSKELTDIIRTYRRCEANNYTPMSELSIRYG